MAISIFIVFYVLCEKNEGKIMENNLRQCAQRTQNERKTFHFDTKLFHFDFDDMREQKMVQQLIESQFNIEKCLKEAKRSFFLHFTHIHLTEKVGKAAMKRRNINCSFYFALRLQCQIYQYIYRLYVCVLVNECAR